MGTDFAAVLALGVLNYLPELAPSFTTMAPALGNDGVIVVNVPTAERSAGDRYRRSKLLGRRRVYCRDRDDVEVAAQPAGLGLDRGPVRAGVTDV